MKLLKELLTDPESRRHLYFFLLSYFFVLFNYPLVRASSTTMFLGEFGAKSSPAAWLITVIVLIVTIFIFNRFQARHSVQIVFLWVSILSTSIFAASTLGYQLHTRYASYFSFIWKEICIVLQVHLLLAYANNYFRKEDFKSIVGPVGAIGSIGGILGGVVTTFLGKKLGPAAVSWFSLLFVLIPAFFFLWTPELKTEGRETKESPVESLNNPDVQKYVFYISLIVMLSQFVINLADFKFNIIFEKSVHLASDRTAYLGSIYTWTNVLSLVFQFALLPFLLKKISERSLHLFIPASYLSLLVALFFSGEYALPPLAMFYIYLKATDYSLFSGGKELFYQVLSPEQKYGAKYISDMFVYRASKALIALVLIYFQSSFILNMLMIVFLFFWLVFVLKIFRFHHNFFH